MKCNQCNTEISDESNFCPNCGHRFPNIKRDKPSFNIKFLKMIFGDEQTKYKSEVEKKEEKNIQIKGRKWGWEIGRAHV